MSEQNTVSAPGKKRRRPIGSRILNILLLIAVIIVALLFVRAEQQRRSIEENLQKTEQELEQIRKSTENSGQEAANQVLEKVRQLIDIPAEPAPTVATIVDVDALRQSNEFYNKANNGDTLIITANRAILYNAERNLILDVVPVEINQDAAPAASPGAQTPGEPSPAAPGPEATALP